MRRFILFQFFFIFCLNICEIEQSFAKFVQPFKVSEELVHVTCINDGSELRKQPDKGSSLVKKIPWMASFVMIEEKTDSQDRDWIKVGRLKSIDEAELLGWILKDNLLMRQRAKKEDGIYKKAIVVVHYDQNNQIIGGAPVRKAPLESVNPTEQELTLFDIFHIYDKRNDFRSGETFFLLGDESEIMDPGKPETTIVGWVNKKKLFEWNTRQAAEYDKSTLNSRKPVKIYETEEDLKRVINNNSVNSIAPLATEATDKTHMLPSDPRFPIITKQRENRGIKMWRIGFIGDEIGGPGTTKREKVARLSRLPNVVDIFFVFDGSGSMREYKDSVIQAVKQVQQAATDYWLEHYPGETQADIRFSLTMYKDYSEAPNHYKRIPLDKDNAREIETFLNDYDFSGGQDQPAVFHGISSTLKDGEPEMRKESFRMMILIGDMGNMGVSNEPDPKGHTITSIISQLKTTQSDFYAIHLASSLKDPAFVKFEREAKNIKNKLPQGYAEYIPLIDPRKVKEEIYDKIIQILDQRYRLPQTLKNIAKGRKLLGKQISGTILEQRAIDIMKRHGLNPYDFARKGIAAFARGWVAPIEQGTGIRVMKPVVLMNKVEVETLIALLGRITKVKTQNVQKGWASALEDVTGDNVSFDPKSGIPAEIINKHLGIPVKSGVLNMSFQEIGKLSPAKITETIKEFKKKLFLLRAVVNEKDIKFRKDNKGNISYVPTGDKKYWFGTRGSERVWLDMEVYLP
jgi:hypothetical protein